MCARACACTCMLSLACVHLCVCVCMHACVFIHSGVCVFICMCVYNSYSGMKADWFWLLLIKPPDWCHVWQLAWIISGFIFEHLNVWLWNRCAKIFSKVCSQIYLIFCALLWCVWGGTPTTPTVDSRKACQYPRLHIQFYKLLTMGGKTAQNMWSADNNKEHCVSCISLVI